MQKPLAKYVEVVKWVGNPFNEIMYTLLSQDCARPHALYTCPPGQYTLVFICCMRPLVAQMRMRVGIGGEGTKGGYLLLLWLPLSSGYLLLLCLPLSSVPTLARPP